MASLQNLFGYFFYSLDSVLFIMMQSGVFLISELNVVYFDGHICSK